MVINSKELHSKIQSRTLDNITQDRQINRLKQQGQQLENERMAIVEKYHEDEMKDCTFRPQVNKRKNGEKRNFKKFLADL